MKVNFITSQPHAACSMFYFDALKRIPSFSFYDQEIRKYDVILVMTYDHAHLKKIREIHPTAKIGLIDPRNYKVEESLRYADFIIIDSIEMQDYWSKIKKPMFRYAEYPDIPDFIKTHSDKRNISIGYHGNQIHLSCMQNTVTPALERLSKNYDIELVVMYSGSPPTGNEKWVPKGVKVKHVHWSMQAYNELSKCDIGIAPNNLLHDEAEKEASKTSDMYNYSRDDFSLRFKMPSNFGRIIVFGKLGIPVVADFYPSALQYLSEDKLTGMVACNSSGWEFCLEKLIVSHELRQEMGDGLQNLVKSEFDFDNQNTKLLEFLRAL